MRNLLIIYPSWLPSNAVGVQRVRLLAKFLPDQNWSVTLITVHESFYEEEKSDDLLVLTPPNIRVFKVCACRHTRFHIIGDISLRAFFQLTRFAIQLIKKEQFHCMWIPIPSFYTSLIGRIVHEKTNIPYIIDYIDPWVHSFPGKNIRARLATLASKILEPIAVKKCSALSGVAEQYYLPVLRRNKKISQIPCSHMPYGFDSDDYKHACGEVYLWDSKKIQAYIYAGAFLPSSHRFIQFLFEYISELKNENLLGNKRFFFIGTGYSTLNSITDYAFYYNIEDVVTEIKGRISYLDVLTHLKEASGVMIIGSSEAHYNASKVFQSILSGKPLFGILHEMSDALKILADAKCDKYFVRFYDCMTESLFKQSLENKFYAFLFEKNWLVDMKKLDKYSAKHSAHRLAILIDKAVNPSCRF